MLKTHYIQTAPREQQYQHPQEPVPDEWNNSVPPPPRRKNKGKKHSHRRVWKSSPQKCLHPEVFEIDPRTDSSLRMTKLHENSLAKRKKDRELNSHWGVERAESNEAKWKRSEARRPVISARFMLFRLFAGGPDGEGERDGHSLAI